MVKIERQTSVLITRYKTFTGYVANHFDTPKFIFLRQKPTLWFMQRKSNFDIDKTFRALKMIAWSLSSHHIEKRLNADYTFPFKSSGRFSNLLRLKFAFKFTKYCSSMVGISFLNVIQNLSIFRTACGKGRKRICLFSKSSCFPIW